MDNPNKPFMDALVATRAKFRKPAGLSFFSAQECDVCQSVLRAPLSFVECDKCPLSFTGRPVGCIDNPIQQRCDSALRRATRITHPNATCLKFPDDPALMESDEKFAEAMFALHDEFDVACGFLGAVITFCESVYEMEPDAFIDATREYIRKYVETMGESC